MKKLIVSSLLALFFFGFLFVNINQADAYVNVSGYYKKNGTYVAPHVRSNPNGLKYDNYGYKPSQGLYNPSYGTKGSTWDTPTYITDPNYYEGKSLYDSGSYGYSSPSTYTKTPSCPSMSSYNSATDNCQCYSGYVVSGSSCVNAALYCSDKIGIMSQYNSTSKMCECMYGYEYNGSSCVYKKTSSLYGASAYDSYTASNYSCPLNSHKSPTDSSQCLCDTGYGISAKKDSCVVLPVKTPNQICKDSFGINSVPAYNKNDKGETMCTCNLGYEWSTDNKSCVQSISCTGDNIQSGNKCITLDESCQSGYGINSVGVVGSKKLDNTGQCACKTGYVFSSDMKSCIISSVTKVTKPNSNKDEIKNIQEKLIKKGYLKSSATGTFDKATITAVKLFQASKGLKADGLVGVKTTELLNK